MSLWFDSSANANKLRQSYLKGFLDISGGDVRMRHNNNINLYDTTDQNVPQFQLNAVNYTVNDESATPHTVSVNKLAYLDGLGSNIQQQFNDLKTGTAGNVVTQHFDASDGNVTGNLAVGKNLTVSGNADFKNNVAIGGDLSLNGNIIIGGDELIKKNLIVDGDALIVGALTVTADVSFQHNLLVMRSIDLRQNIGIGGALDMSGAAVLHSTLNVNGASTLDSLEVLHATKLDGTLNVIQDASFNGKMAVQGDASFNSDMTIAGKLTVSSITIGGEESGDSTGFTVNQPFTATDGATISGDLSLNARLFVAQDVSMNSNAYVNGSFKSHGAATFDDAVTITKAATLSSTLSVSKAATFSDIMTVSKATGLSSTLDVSKAATFSDIVTVAGATQVNNTFGATGAATLSSTLSVSKAATFSDIVTVAGATQVNNTFGATGAATFGDKMTVALDASFNGAMDVKYNLSAANLNTAGQANLGDVNIAGHSINTIDTAELTLQATGKLTHIMGDLTVEGNYNVMGAFNTINTTVTVTEKFDVSNNGTGPAFTATQWGSGVMLASFNDNGYHTMTLNQKMMGLGMLNPLYTLDISGSEHLSGALLVDSDLTVGGKISVPTMQTSTNANAVSMIDNKIQIGTGLTMTSTTISQPTGYWAQDDGTW